MCELSELSELSPGKRAGQAPSVDPKDGLVGDTATGEGCQSCPRTTLEVLRYIPSGASVHASERTMTWYPTVTVTLRLSPGFVRALDPLPALGRAPGDAFAHPAGLKRTPAFTKLDRRFV